MHRPVSPAVRQIREVRNRLEDIENRARAARYRGELTADQVEEAIRINGYVTAALAHAAAFGSFCFGCGEENCQDPEHEPFRW